MTMSVELKLTAPQEMLAATTAKCGSASSLCRKEARCAMVLSVVRGIEQFSGSFYFSM